MGPRGRHERHELLEQLGRLGDHVCRAVAPATLEPVEQSPVGQTGESPGGDRRTGHVTAEVLEPPAVAGRHDHARVQAEAAACDAGGLGRVGFHVLGIDPVAEPPYAPAGALSGGDSPADGGVSQAGEQWLVIGQEAVLLAAPVQQLVEPPRDASQHALQLRPVGRRRRVKGTATAGLVHAVQNQRVEVHVEIEGVAEALHERDGAALRPKELSLPAGAFA